MFGLLKVAVLFALTSSTIAAPHAASLPHKRSVTVSEDGQTITVDGRSISVDDAMSNSCSSPPTTGEPPNPPATGSIGWSNSSSSAPKAIYFISNTANNFIVALNVAANGLLYDGSITPTGGMGMSSLESSDNSTAGPDALNSQGAVAVAGNILLAVNPGSDTVSMFKISAKNPTHLTMVGKPASTLGEFPVSVALSPTKPVACVANTGTQSGVACYSVCPDTGLKLLDTAQRPMPLGQTTPPHGPLNTISQTFFNADSSALMTTVKGDPSVNNTGYLSVFAVAADGAAVSRDEARTSPAGTAVLFGIALLPGAQNLDKLFVADASFGSVTLEVASCDGGANVTSEVLAKTVIPDQAATCWTTYSDVTRTAFVTDVAVNHLVEVDTASGAIVRELNLTNGNQGLIDLVASGDFIYALSPGNASTGARVTVFDISGGRGSAKEIQNFAPKGVSPFSAQGMAMF